MTYSREFIDNLLNMVNIKDIMSPAVQGMKSAGGNYVCICPFHSERTPSCHIYFDHFHCFGCGAHGNALTFLRLTENITFKEAISRLCEITGTPLPKPSNPTEVAHQERIEREKYRIYDMNEAVCEFYVLRLFSRSGIEGVDYLRKRGISASVAKKFRLGYAEGNGSVIDLLSSKGFSEAEIIKGFFAKRNQKTGRLYEVFKSRIMFPVIDVLGKVVAFSGRTILQNPPEYEPKYKNSGETLVYHKSDFIFALNFAKTKSGNDPFIICEGNLDAVSLHQAGFETAVATLGTAFTPSHARLISRYGKNAVLCLDNDEAGVKALVRTSNLLNEAGVKTSVVMIPDESGAKDPDEFIKKFGDERFKSLLKNAVSSSKALLINIKKNLNLDEPESRISYMNSAIEILSQIENESERMIYSSEVARECRIQESVFINQMNEKVNKSIKIQSYKTEKKIQDVALNIINSGTSNKNENTVLAFMFEINEKIPKIIGDLSENDFSDSFVKKIFNMVFNEILAGRIPSIYNISEMISPAETSKLESLIMAEKQFGFSDERLENAMSNLKKKELSTNDLVNSIAAKINQNSNV